MSRWQQVKPNLNTLGPAPTALPRATHGRPPTGRQGIGHPTTGQGQGATSRADCGLARSGPGGGHTSAQTALPGASAGPTCCLVDASPPGPQLSLRFQGIASTCGAPSSPWAPPTNHTDPDVLPTSLSLTETPLCSGPSTRDRAEASQAPAVAKGRSPQRPRSPSPPTADSGPWRAPEDGQACWRGAQRNLHHVGDGPTGGSHQRSPRPGQVPPESPGRQSWQQPK